MNLSSREWRSAKDGWREGSETFKKIAFWRAGIQFALIILFRHRIFAEASELKNISSRGLCAFRPSRESERGTGLNVTRWIFSLLSFSPFHVAMMKLCQTIGEIFIAFIHFFFCGKESTSSRDVFARVPRCQASAARFVDFLRNGWKLVCQRAKLQGAELRSAVQAESWIELEKHFYWKQTPKTAQKSLKIFSRNSLSSINRIKAPR